METNKKFSKVLKNAKRNNTCGIGGYDSDFNHTSSSINKCNIWR